MVVTRSGILAVFRHASEATAPYALRRTERMERMIRILATTCSWARGKTLALAFLLMAALMAATLALAASSAHAITTFTVNSTNARTNIKLADAEEVSA